MSAIAFAILGAGVFVAMGLYKLAEAIRSHGNCIRDAQIMETRRTRKDHS